MVGKIDLENLGARWMRQRPFRARVQALVDATGPVHHAAYAVPPETDDSPLAFLLAELCIAPLRVAPGPDAAELALLAHARHVHATGGRIFLVGSADGRFAELADLGRVELLVWDGQPVATRLVEVAHHVHRIARPTGTPADDTTEPTQPDHDENPPAPAVPHGTETSSPDACSPRYSPASGSPSANDCSTHCCPADADTPSTSIARHTGVCSGVPRRLRGETRCGAVPTVRLGLRGKSAGMARRAAHESPYWSDIARSYHQWGRPEQCYRALLAAEDASPDEVRYCKPIQQITTSLLRNSVARTLPGLHAFARRNGALA